MRGDSIANVCVLAGVGMMSWAAWLVHPAAGWAVAGLAIFVIGIAIARSLK